MMKQAWKMSSGWDLPQLLHLALYYIVLTNILRSQSMNIQYIHDIERLRESIDCKLYQHLIEDGNPSHCNAGQTV